jgi:hypothetical protein
MVLKELALASFLSFFFVWRNSHIPRSAVKSRCLIAAPEGGICIENCRLILSIDSQSLGFLNVFMHIVSFERADYAFVIC